ncbi:hypothetical protein DXT63_08415 [Thermoanaerobacteraceae bacterium SP2]|nr:hypothetical protein DXT63_08415 [Thermoanaerobacteraceae bacterium SP2]
MKKFIIILVISLLLITSSVSAAVEQFILTRSPFPIIVNGQALKSDLPVLNYKGNTYIPLKKVGEALGVPVEFKDNKIVIGEVVKDVLLESGEIIDWIYISDLIKKYNLTGERLENIGYKLINQQGKVLIISPESMKKARDGEMVYAIVEGSDFKVRVKSINGATYLNLNDLKQCGFIE